MACFSAFLSPAAVRPLLALLALAVCLPAGAQAPAWQSARTVAVAATAAAGNFSAVQATAADAAGNVYVAGSFANTVVLGGTTLTSLGGRDVFVAKFNPAGNQFAWAQRAGGAGDDYATTLAVSGAGVFVAGYFSSPTAGFGATTLASTGFADVFVAKLTDAGSAGSFAWAQRAGGLGEDRAHALAVSGTSVYVTGYIGSSTTDFGPFTLNGSLPLDVFVAKLTDAGGTGSFAWVQRAGGAGHDQAYALAVSGTSVYIAGDFIGPTADFGTVTLANAGAGTRDVFVAKLTDAGSTGSFAWAQRAGGTGFDQAYALAVSGTSVYVAGFFGGPTADFGTTILASAGFADVFVAKLADAGSTGSFAWAQRAGGTGPDRAEALAVSGANVYVAGFFGSPTAGFGTTTLANAGTGPAAGTNDVFVAKLTDAGPTGSFAWGLQAGGTGFDQAGALAVAGTSVYVAGLFTSPAPTFGTIALSNPGTVLGFLAAVTDPTLTATAAGQPRSPTQLFPNPARRTAALHLPAGVIPAPLTLTDALGRAVRHYPAPAGPDTELDLQGLPTGLYLLRGIGPAQRVVVE